MTQVTPIKHDDGTETVRLYGTTVDVNGQSRFTLFKKDYKVVRGDDPDERTKDELIELAKQQEVSGYSSMNKAELAEAISQE